MTNQNPTITPAEIVKLDPNMRRDNSVWPPVSVKQALCNLRGIFLGPKSHSTQRGWPGGIRAIAGSTLITPSVGDSGFLGRRRVAATGLLPGESAHTYPRRD